MKNHAPGSLDSKKKDGENRLEEDLASDAKPGPPVEISSRKIFMGTANPILQLFGLHLVAKDEETEGQVVLADVLNGLQLRRKHYINLEEHDQKLSRRVRHSYCAPTFSTFPVVLLLAVYLTAFYEDMGVTLGYLSFFIALARSLDVMTDPLMSYITDSCRTRFGRRRPFCVTGCWFYAFFLICLLYPPKMSVVKMNSWFGAFYILFFIANTFTTIPYDALGPELTDNYEDRNRLFFVSGLYDGFGGLLAVILPNVVAEFAYMATTIACDDSTCYSDSGIGIDCLPNINTGIYAEYDLGFDSSMVNISTSAMYGPGSFTSDLCSTVDNPSLGLENYCDCIGKCSTRCTLESKRVAYMIVGFFYGAWFCITMLNLWMNVKERAQQKLEDKENKESEKLEVSKEIKSPVTPKEGAKNVSFQKDDRGDDGAEETQSLAKEREEETSFKSDNDDDDEEEVWNVHPYTSKDPENYEAELKANPPLVPALLNTFRNKPFALLLPAWVCDQVGFSILASMITYYVRYVIQPEYQTLEENGVDCNEGRAIEGEDSDAWYCSTTYVLGLLVVCLLVCAFLGLPLWLLAAKKLGKRNAWLLWSFTMAITNAVFFSVGKGDIALGIALGGLNGLPAGAKFLSDAILADTIDYDEFLTGQRNEATYTMFKSFLPKICAIPAAAIPLAIMEVLGHVAPVDGRIMQQEPIIAKYCVIVTVAVPLCLSLLSFVLKCRYPLKNKKMVDEISIGIGAHIGGGSYPDPISGKDVSLPKQMTKQQKEELDLIDYFPGTAWLEKLLEHDQQHNFLKTSSGKRGHLMRRDSHFSALRDSTITKVMKVLWKKVLVQLLTALTLLVISMTLVAATFTWLDNSKLSVIPVLLVICFGISMTFTCFCCLRLHAAERLEALLQRGDHRLTRKFLKQVVARRKLLKEIGEAAKKKSSIIQEYKAFFKNKEIQDAQDTPKTDAQDIPTTDSISSN